jgi:hypothetical protein
VINVILVLIAASAALLAFLAFVVVVLGIHATERRYALRQRGSGHIDMFTRRLLGVYADRSSRANKPVEHEYTRK